MATARAGGLNGAAVGGDKNGESPDRGSEPKLRRMNVVIVSQCDAGPELVVAGCCADDFVRFFGACIVAIAQLLLISEALRQDCYLYFDINNEERIRALFMRRGRHLIPMTSTQADGPASSSAKDDGYFENLVQYVGAAFKSTEVCHGSSPGLR